MKPIIDSHLDLALNALFFDRDLTEDVTVIRSRETRMDDSQCRGNATISLEELHRGGVALAFVTILARARREIRATGRVDLDFGCRDIAAAHGFGQLAYYRILQRKGLLRFVSTREEIDAFWAARSADDPGAPPLGALLTMEGADPILDPEHLEDWWNEGLRILSLVHYGRSAYAVGTGEQGPLTPAGPELLQAMEARGVILDATHLSDPGFFQALEVFGGPVCATHNNCRTLVPAQRQFSDEQLRLLIERDAVIGCAMDNWMLYPPGWKIGLSPRDAVTLETVADHIDHICQLSGSSRHAAIGSDLDGGFGTEQSPADLDTIADLRKLEGILANRGYAEADIEGIFSGNWLRFLRRHLPAA